MTHDTDVPGLPRATQARHYENEFYKDMRDLGVALPDVLTRVSEYVEPVVDYVQKLIDHGAGLRVAAASSSGFPRGTLALRPVFRATSAARLARRVSPSAWRRPRVKRSLPCVRGHPP